MCANADEILSLNHNEHGLQNDDWALGPYLKQAEEKYGWAGPPITTYNRNSHPTTYNLTENKLKHVFCVWYIPFFCQYNAQWHRGFQVLCSLLSFLVSPAIELLHHNNKARCWFMQLHHQMTRAFPVLVMGSSRFYSFSHSPSQKTAGFFPTVNRHLVCSVQQ